MGRLYLSLLIRTLHSAGLVGAGAYAILTTSLQISPRNALLAFSFLPAIMLFSFFIVLPRGVLQNPSSGPAEYEAIAAEDTFDDEEERQTHSEH